MNFLHYITKSRKGKEAQRIEREAMTDPFLADAIEGYDLVTNEDTIKRIDNIRGHIHRKTHKKASFVRTAGMVAGIAASLLILVGIGSLFLSRVDSRPLQQESIIAYSPDTEPALEKEVERSLESARDYRQKIQSTTASDAPMLDESDWDYDMAEEDWPEESQKPANSLTVPEPTPLNNNAIKGEPKPATGERAYKEYISDNLFLPAFDECADTKGQVIVAFKVNAKGRPYDFDIKKSLCPVADQEAIRVVQQGPNWTSGDKIATITIRF
jgi:hypothetical protein